MFLVTKKDGTTRAIFDYHRMIKATELNNYTILLTNECIDTFIGYDTLSTINIRTLIINAQGTQKAN